MTDFEKFAKAFQLWEEDYRVNPSEYMTEEECAKCIVSELSVDRASHFLALIREVERCN